MKLSNQLKKIEKDFVSFGKDMGYKSYSDYLKKINEFIEWRFDIDRVDIQEVCSMKLGDFRKYFFYLKDEGQAQNTIAKKRIALLNFYSYLEGEEYIESNPVKDTKVPKIKKDKRDKITYEEALVLYNDVKKNETLQNIAIMSMFVHQGLRENEIGAFKIENYLKHKDNDEIYTEAPKNDFDRLVVLQPKCKQDIQNYIDSTLYLGETGFLFPSRTSKSGHVSNAIIKTILKNSMKRTRLNKHVTPHDFRSALGTHMVAMGVEQFEVAYSLGHTLSTSMKYYRNYQNSTMNKNIKEKMAV